MQDDQDDSTEAASVTSTRGTTLVRTLLDLQREKKSGTLDVDGGGTHTVVYIADGKPVFAEAGSLSDTLGRLLVREGALTQAQYAAILARMTEALFQAEAMRFGEVAVALGFLTPQQVHESLAAQVQQKVIRCIALTQATFTFRESKDWTKEVGHFPAAVEPLILHAAASLDSERIDALLKPDTGARPRMLQDAESTATAFALGGAEQRFLSMIDGQRTVRELLAMEEVDGAALLAALVLSGHATITDPSKPSIVEILAPPSGTAPPDAMRISYAELARERRRRLVPFTAPKAPPGPSEGAAAPGRAQAEAILKRMWEARRSSHELNAPPKPKTPAEARLLAEAAFQLGAGYLRANSLARAAQELRRAVEISPEATEYTLYAKWAEFAHEQGKLSAAEKAAQLASLEVSAEAALEQVTDLGFAHYVLGQVYSHEGDDERALRSFRRAARLDPELIDAERHVRLLELRKRRSAPSQAEMVAAKKPAAVAAKPATPKPAAVAPKAPPPPAPRPATRPVPFPATHTVAKAPAVPAAPAPAAPVAAAPAAPQVTIPDSAPMEVSAVEVLALADAASVWQPLAPPLPGARATAAVEPAPVPAALVERAPIEAAPAPPAPAPPAPAPPAPALVMMAAAPVEPFPATADPPAPALVTATPRTAEGSELTDTGAVVPSMPPPRGGSRRVAFAALGVLGFVALAIGGLVIAQRAWGKRPTTNTLTTATVTTPATATVTAPVAATATATAPATAPVAATASATGGDYGMVTASAATSRGHRISIDGHAVGDAPGPFRVRCGPHAIRLGSHGKTHKIDVPCGGTSDLDAR
jgi:tetratricopeptide (TPR) repeat protein